MAVTDVSQDVLLAHLAEARQALHALEIGRRSIKVMVDGYMVEYSRANLDQLRAYEKRLIALINGRPVGGAINVIF